MTVKTVFLKLNIFFFFFNTFETVLKSQKDGNIELVGKRRENSIKKMWVIRVYFTRSCISYAALYDVIVLSRVQW